MPVKKLTNGSEIFTMPYFEVTYFKGKMWTIFDPKRSTFKVRFLDEEGIFQQQNMHLSEYVKGALSTMFNIEICPQIETGCNYLLQWYEKEKAAYDAFKGRQTINIISGWTKPFMPSQKAAKKKEVVAKKVPRKKGGFIESELTFNLYRR